VLKVFVDPPGDCSINRFNKSENQLIACRVASINDSIVRKLYIEGSGEQGSEENILTPERGSIKKMRLLRTPVRSV
jgi:hypothetical protein